MRMHFLLELHFFLDNRIIIDLSQFTVSAFFCGTKMATRLRKPQLDNTKPLHYIFRGLITDDVDG